MFYVCWPGEGFWLGAKGSYSFALRWKDVQEYLENEVLSLYKGGKTAVSVDGELSSSFPVKVGVHKGPAFSPLSFIMVMDGCGIWWYGPCHAWRHQFQNTWCYKSWNKLEKEFVERLLKEGFGTIRLEKRGFFGLKEITRGN